jgi:excisionase family DNA binding protein
MTNKLFMGMSGEVSVSSIQTIVREELTSLKKSLSVDESGPLGVKEAARYLKMSSPSIYKEVEKESIPFYQSSPGSKIFFYKEELDSWVRGKKNNSKANAIEEADNLKIGGYGRN